MNEIKIGEYILYVNRNEKYAEKLQEMLIKTMDALSVMGFTVTIKKYKYVDDEDEEYLYVEFHEEKEQREEMRAFILTFILDFFTKEVVVIYFSDLTNIFKENYKKIKGKGVNLEEPVQYLYNRRIYLVTGANQ